MDLAGVKTGLKIKLKKGDIVSVDLGTPPNEIKGHEQGNKRPCFVVKSLPPLELAIVLPITTTTPGNPHFTTVKLTAGTANLSSDSYVLCHQIRTVSFDRIAPVPIGTLSDNDIEKIQIVLLDLIEFDS